MSRWRQRLARFRVLRQARDLGLRTARNLRLRLANRRQELYQQRLAAANLRLREAPAADQPGKLYVVINIDTEGPCGWCKNQDWPAIEREVRAVSEDRFRHAYRDSIGRPLALSWFAVTWVGADTSARSRSLGHHQIFDPYRRWIDQHRARGLEDELFWHYHHVFPGNIEGCNRDWSSFPQYEEILSRLVLDRGWFPACYRAGNTWESADCSAWLERWIPFDFSNRAPQAGWNYDWARAPCEWSLYAPAPEDPQKPGSQSRRMARSLSIENGWFRPQEVEAAFLRARRGLDAYVSFFTHDYREMRDFVERGADLIYRQAALYPEVPLLNVNALEAFRQLTGGGKPAPLQLDLERYGQELQIRSDRPLQGPQPWIAARSTSEQVRRLDCQRRGECCWTLDMTRLEIAELAVGAADRSGATGVVHLPSSAATHGRAIES